MPILKRALDIVCSATAIIMFSPLLLGTAIAIKLDESGADHLPIEARRERYRIFDFLKFRSMYIDADQHIGKLKDRDQYANTTDDDDARIRLTEEQINELLANTNVDTLFSDDFTINEEDRQKKELKAKETKTFVKIEDDPRITRIGKFIRKLASTNYPNCSTSCAATCRSSAIARYRSTKPNASPATSTSNASCVRRGLPDCGKSKKNEAALANVTRTAQATRHSVCTQYVDVARPRKSCCVHSPRSFKKKTYRYEIICSTDDCRLYHVRGKCPDKACFGQRMRPM